MRCRGYFLTLAGPLPRVSLALRGRGAFPPMSPPGPPPCDPKLKSSCRVLLTLPPTLDRCPSKSLIIEMKRRENAKEQYAKIAKEKEVASIVSQVSSINAAVDARRELARQRVEEEARRERESERDAINARILASTKLHHAREPPTLWL
jgi:hypothetical protein